MYRFDVTILVLGRRKFEAAHRAYLRNKKIKMHDILLFKYKKKTLSSTFLKKKLKTKSQIHTNLKILKERFPFSTVADKDRGVKCAFCSRMNGSRESKGLNRMLNTS